MGVLPMPQAIFGVEGPKPTFELRGPPVEGVSLP